MDKTYAAVQNTFMPIQAYPAFNVDIAIAASMLSESEFP